MDLLQHTTYDQIRSLLGVSARELADATLALPHWTLTVEQELLDIDGGAGAVMAQWVVVNAIAANARTTAQTQYFNVVNMLVLYEMGSLLIQSADVFSPIRITDGKAALERLQARFDKLRPAIEGGVERLKQRVRDALLVLVPGTAVSSPTERVMIAGVPLGTDPVTGV